MRAFATLIAALLATSQSAHPDVPAADAVPSVCLQDAQGSVNYKACFDGAEPKTGAWYWAAINLGSTAFWNGQMTEAAHYFDLSTADGINTFSDIILHSNRAIVFRKVGRLEDSLKDARRAWTMVQENRFDGFDLPLTDDAKSYALLSILETFYVAGAPEFQSVLDVYLSMPIDDVNTFGNKAAILGELGRPDLALKINEDQLKLTPNDPVLLNNQCYVLTSVGRAAEGLPHCKLANELEPDTPYILHSLAVAYAALGDCIAAEKSRKKAKSLDPATTLYEREISCSPSN